MKIFGICGFKNSGKTGLTERLVAEFCARGLSVSTIKHTHHDFDIDRPGTDSYRHRQAGASEVALVSGHRMALMRESAPDSEPRLEEIIARLSPVDLVLVEGFKRDPIPKIECRRLEARSVEPLCDGDVHIIAIAADHATHHAQLPVFHLDDTREIADFIAQHLKLKKTE